MEKRRFWARPLFRYSLVALLTTVVVERGPGLWRKERHIGGSVRPGWERVREAFSWNHEGGWEKEGSAFAVFHKGKLVVDLWGGYADKASGRLWKHDTKTVAYSCTKSVSAMAALLLVDRGELDLDAKVTKYWPQFGKHGKDRLTVRHLLTHRAGLAAIDFDRQITMDMARGDWRNLSRIFEDQIPNWELGEDRHGYHVITYGWLLDQLIRRADPLQRSLGSFVSDEIALPHDIDFWIGNPLTEFHRTARAANPTLRETITSLGGFFTLFMKLQTLVYMVSGSRNLFDEAFHNPSFLRMDDGHFKTNDPEVQNLEIGSANGVSTARDLAKIFSLYSQGKLVRKNGTVWDQLLVPIVSPTIDLVIYPVPIDWNLGLWTSTTPQGLMELGHPGYGGQNVKFVPELELSFAYLTNGLTPDMGDDAHNFGALRKALYQSLEEITDS